VFLSLSECSFVTEESIIKYHENISNVKNIDIQIKEAVDIYKQSLDLNHPHQKKVDQIEVDGINYNFVEKKKTLFGKNVNQYVAQSVNNSSKFMETHIYSIPRHLDEYNYIKSDATFLYTAFQFLNHPDIQETIFPAVEFIDIQVPENNAVFSGLKMQFSSLSLQKLLDTKSTNPELQKLYTYIEKNSEHIFGNFLYGVKALKELSININTITMEHVSIFVQSTISNEINQVILKIQNISNVTFLTDRSTDYSLKLFPANFDLMNPFGIQHLKNEYLCPCIYAILHNINNPFFKCGDLIKKKVQPKQKILHEYPWNDLLTQLKTDEITNIKLELMTNDIWSLSFTMLHFFCPSLVISLVKNFYDNFVVAHWADDLTIILNKCRNRDLLLPCYLPIKDFLQIDGMNRWYSLDQWRLPINFHPKAIQEKMDEDERKKTMRSFDKRDSLIYKLFQREYQKLKSMMNDQMNEKYPRSEDIIAHCQPISTWGIHYVLRLSIITREKLNQQQLDEYPPPKDEHQIFYQYISAQGNIFESYEQNHKPSILKVPTKIAHITSSHSLVPVLLYKYENSLGNLWEYVLTKHIADLNLHTINPIKKLYRMYVPHIYPVHTKSTLSLGYAVESPRHRDDFWNHWYLQSWVEKNGLYLFQQSFLDLMKLKQHGIILHDVKSENLVLDLDAKLIKYIDFERSHFAFDSDSRGNNEKYFFFGTRAYTSPLGFILNGDSKLYESLETTSDEIQYDFWSRKEVKVYYGTSLEVLHQMEIITSDIWSLAISYIQIHCKNSFQFINNAIEKFFKAFTQPSVYANFTFLEKMIAAEKVSEEIQIRIEEQCQMINPELKQILKILLELNPFKRWEIATNVEQNLKSNIIIEDPTPLVTDQILIDPYDTQKRLERMEKNFQLRQEKNLKQENKYRSNGIDNRIK
jgi:hypothetical protein